MSNFKLTKEFKEKMFWDGITSVQAPEPAKADVLCNSIKITFNKKTTKVTLYQDKLSVCESILPSDISLGSEVHIKEMKIYYPIEMAEED